jgi:hypothetical protein
VFDPNYRTFQHLRLEAMQAFERCIHETNIEIMEAFLESQLVLDPPPVELLRGIADDVRGRLYQLKTSSDLSAAEQEIALRLVEQIYHYLNDWIGGLNALMARRATAVRWLEPPQYDQHNRLH